MNERRPYLDVRVNLAMGSPEYIVTAMATHGWEYKSWFEEIGDLLGGRPGWHCDLTSEGILSWSFGAFGASLFNISPPKDAEAEDGRFSVFDYEADEVVPFDAVSPLREWLDENEPRHAGHAGSLRALAAVNNWAPLTRVGLEARVDYADGTWIGTITTIPSEATFGRSLSHVVRALREMVGAVLDVPTAIIPKIRLQVTLEANAVDAIE